MLKINQEDFEKLVIFRKKYPDIDIRVIEKDILNTHALFLLSNININSTKIIFCGGTSLFKGYNIISRMSEDIDFKIVINYKNSSRNKNRNERRNIKYAMDEYLTNAGFAPTNLRARDENRFFSFYIPFQSMYEEWGILNPVIRIECIDIPVAFSPIERTIRSFVDQMLNINGSEFILSCQNPQEILIEKTIALLRRLTDDRSEFSEKPQLVRHIYDVSKMILTGIPITDKMIFVFNEKISAEITRYETHCQAFADNPKDTFWNSLEWLQTGERFRENYENWIVPTLIKKDLQYQQCLDIFSKVASTLINSMPDKQNFKP